MKSNLKRITVLIFVFMFLTACGEQGKQAEDITNEAVEVKEKINIEDATEIILSDESILVEGNEISKVDTDGVYRANDIIYYETGHDFTYGEGTAEEAHTESQAKQHTVVHITEPGMYSLTGKLSKGQIAIDLGEEVDDDPNAVVTLVLNNVDINCDVAPAVIFYNVYECGSKEEADATNDVDTTKAGANVYIMNSTENNITGSHVARIYESYELNEEGIEVVDSKKLHKYDAAFYSKMTMNVDGAENTTGVLNIDADNEGLDSELHLTINGGNINISSGNDGINTNEDGISVTTINGGSVNIHVTGTTGEGDGIDSNGWLVINGGTVVAEACGTSGDAGIDSDMGIHINGGNVIATGNMLDHISESKQNYVVMNFSEAQKEGSTYTLKNDKDEVVATLTPMNKFSYLILSNENTVEGIYTFWQDNTQLAGSSGQMLGGGMMKPEDGEMPEEMEAPENGEMLEGMERPAMPEGMEPPEKPTDEKRPQDGQGGFGNRGEIPEGIERPEMPEKMELSKGFAISSNGNYYSNVSVIPDESN